MGLSTNRTGDVEFGPAANAGVAVSGPLALDWFDRWLLGRDTGPAGGVRYWQVGHRGLARHRLLAAAAHDASGGTCARAARRSTSAGDGLLAPDAPAGGRAADGYRYDPATPDPDDRRQDADADDRPGRDHRPAASRGGA